MDFGSGGAAEGDCAPRVAGNDYHFAYRGGGTLLRHLDGSNSEPAFNGSASDSNAAYGDAGFAANYRGVADPAGDFWTAVAARHFPRVGGRGVDGGVKGFHRGVPRLVRAR